MLTYETSYHYICVEYYLLHCIKLYVAARIFLAIIIIVETYIKKPQIVSVYKQS
jgi:hypothetical protein